MKIHLALAALPLLALPATAQLGRAPTLTLFEDFESGGNEGNWSFFGDPNNAVEVIEPLGGNPDAWLHSTCRGTACLNTFAPRFRTQLGTSSVFTGDYRAKGVVSLQIDTRILGPSILSTGNRPLSLVLVNDGGTPNVFGDDTLVYVNGHRNIPSVGSGWRRYRFRVPSSRTTLPPRWNADFGSATPDEDWNTVIQDVSQVVFFFGDYELFYLIQEWELGVDNVGITLDVGASGAELVAPLDSPTR